MAVNADKLAERLERCEIELEATRGYMKAMEAGLHAVIATLEEPVDLAELWQHVLVDAPDHSAPGSTELYHSAFRAGLAKLTAMIEGAVDRKRDF